MCNANILSEQPPMTEAEFDAAFADLISRPWPSANEGARPAASATPAPHVYPNFSRRRAPDALEIARGMNEVLLALSAQLADTDAPRAA